jgi:hypothetical protein
MTSTTWTTRDEALDHWSVPELVVFFMSATENLRFSDDETEIVSNV